MSEIHIAGAGLAGMTLAVALAHSGFKVTLIEAQTANTLRHFGQDKRTTALAYTSKVLLENLNIWQDVVEQSAPINSMLVSNASAASLRFDPSTFTDNPMGYIVPNATLRRSLLQHIEHNQQINLVCDKAVKAFVDKGAKLELKYSTEQTVETDLLIGCEGKHSNIRKLAGFSSFDRDYKQSAVVGTVTLSRSHHNQAFQVFTKTGPIALLPLPDATNKASLIWSHETQAAKELGFLAKNDFVALLNKHIQSGFAAADNVENLQVFPLHAHYLSQFVQDKITLLGEAAHGVHPLAGQGFNLTARDIGTLCDVLRNAQNLGEHLGSKLVLERYQNQRVGDTARMFGVTDQLTYMLSGNLRLPAPIRDLGFAAVNQSDLMCKTLTQHAMGLVDNLPTLMTENWLKKFAAA